MHHWGPEQVASMTLRQLKVYCMKPEDVERMHSINRVNAGMKKDPKRKFIDPANEKAIENLKLGNRWDW